MTIRRILLAAVALLVIVPVAAILWLVYTEAGTRFAWQRAELALDGALDAAEVSGTLGRGLRIDALRYRQDGLSLDAESTEVRVGLVLVPLTVDIHEARVHGVRLELPAAVERDPGPQDAGASPALDHLALPLRLRVGELSVTDVVILRADDLLQVIDSASLTGSWHDSVSAAVQVVAPEAEFRLSGVLGFTAPYSVDAELATQLTSPGDIAANARVSGRIDSFDVATTARAVFEGYAPIDVDIAAQGTLDGLQGIDARLMSELVELRAAGRMRWSDEFSVDAEIDVERARIDRLLANWPAAHPVSGSLELSYVPGRLAIDDAELSIAGTSMQMSIDAAVDVDAQTVAGQVDWHGLQWPIDAETADIASPDGTVTLSGKLDDWRTQGALALDVPGIAPGRFQVEAEGGQEYATFRVMDAQVLGGRLSANGNLSWTERGAWSVTVDVDGIRSETLAPSWPGSLSGRIDASGYADPLEFDANVEHLDGTLDGRPIAASGRLSLESGMVRASDFFIRYGADEITLNGSPYTKTGLVFSAYVNDLSSYIAESEGELRTAGRVGIEDGVPWLNMTAAADRLRFGELEVLGFRIDDLAPGAATRSRLSISARDASFRGQQVLEPRVEAEVTAESQTLTMDVGYEGLAFSARVNGALDSWSEPRRWAGELDELVFSFSGHPPVELANPADIRLAAGQASLERLCLREPGGAALCAALAWRDGGRTDVSATLTAMPLTMVNALVDTRFDFDQTVSGDFEWHSAGGVPPTGGAHIVVSPGFIRSVDRRDVSFESAESTLDFEIVDGRLLSGRLELPMPGTGEIKGEFHVLDLVNPLGSEVEGNVKVVMRDVGALAALTPLVDEASGEVNARVDIAGRLAEPVLTGEMNFADGLLAYDPLGVVLSDIDVSARLEGDRGIEIDGTFSSGEGTGRITSRHGNGFRGGVDVKITGEKLRLIDVEEIMALADLDLGLGYDSDGLSIDGRVAVPRARISPRSLPASRISASSDVVVVRGQLPEVEEAEKDADIRITGSLDVELGDAVEVDLGVAEASVTGRTLFTWTGDPVPMADGRFDLRGQVQAFGQVLNIADGGVRFPNVTADNPQLRLRAERDIYGNSQVKTAGVLVAGTLLRPTIEAYTDPRTTEERALTLLVTGSDFDLEQGVGAVDFGTYIAPRLFVSYGIGIFDRDNVISARYDLTEGFGIRATSGQRESGVDVIYRFER